MSSVPLSVQKLTKRFEAGTVNEKLALDGLSLEVPAGQFVTVLGSNGSGKSTLFNAILGKILPDSGRILLGEEDITRQKDYRRALNIGCLHQNPLRGTAPSMTIEENLALAYTRKASRSFFAVNHRDKITTPMITHDMDYALSMGSRTVMLSGGRVVLDLSGPERQTTTAGMLAERFYTRPRKRVEAEITSEKNENSL